jgi:hypothetical protein
VAIELVVQDDAIDLTLRGWDRLWALSSGIHLPIEQITDARVADVAPLKKDLGLRTGGGYWPGKMATGRFTWRHRKGVRQLWAVYGDKEVLVIDTTIAKPARIVIQHPYKHDLAWLIAERIPSAHRDDQDAPALYDVDDE